MNFFGTCLLATHFITSWCSWTRGNSSPSPGGPAPACSGDRGRNVLTRFPEAPCASLLLCLLDEKGKHGPGSGHLVGGWSCHGGEPGLVWKVGGPLAAGLPPGQMLVLRAARRGAQPLPGASRVWVFLSGLLPCNDTNLDVVEAGTFTDLSWSSAACERGWGKALDEVDTVGRAPQGRKED